MPDTAAAVVAEEVLIVEAAMVVGIFDAVCVLINFESVVIIVFVVVGAKEEEEVDADVPTEVVVVGDWLVGGGLDWVVVIGLLSDVFSLTVVSAFAVVVSDLVVEVVMAAVVLGTADVVVGDTVVLNGVVVEGALVFSSTPAGLISGLISVTTFVVS